MTSFEAYQKYLALKNHFTKTSFDYHKYNGKVSVSLESFDKRKDKIFFQKLAKHTDVFNFLLANISNDENIWIRDLVYNESAEKIYKDWLKTQQSLTYTFKNDIDKLNSSFDYNFKCVNNNHPLLMKKYLGKEITLETMCLLLKLTGAQKHWDNKLKYDLIWQKLKHKVEKYTPFIQYEHDKIKNIIMSEFEE